MGNFVYRDREIVKPDYLLDFEGVEDFEESKVQFMSSMEALWFARFREYECNNSEKVLLAKSRKVQKEMLQEFGKLLVNRALGVSSQVAKRDETFEVFNDFSVHANRRDYLLFGLENLIRGLYLEENSSGYEYEMKMDINSKGNFDLNENDLHEMFYAKGLLLSPNVVGPIISNVTYYGNNDGEVFARIKYDSGDEKIRKKGARENLNRTGYVLKRRESFDSVDGDFLSPSKNVKRFFEGVRKKGEIVRKRYSTKLVSLITGHAYSVMHDVCTLPLGASISLEQLEVEYVGYYPLISGKEVDERQVVEGFDDVKYVLDRHVIGGQKSQLTKYNWMLEVLNK